MIITIDGLSMKKKEDFYQAAETQLIQILKRYFNQDSLENIDGRTMAAAFRRFDILLRFLSDNSQE